MTEELQTNILLNIHKTLTSLTSILRETIIATTSRIITEMRMAFGMLAKIMAPRSSSGIAKSALGQNLGVSTQGGLFQKIDEFFQPLQQFAQNIPRSFKGQGQAGLESIPGANMGDLKMGPMIKQLLAPLGRTLKSTFKDVGKSIGASFSPMMLLFQILQPLISAFLEPLELLEPLMSAWGTILSQLLIPIVLSVMDILMPFTPLLSQLVELLLPIISLLPSFINIIIPILEFVINLIMRGITILQIGIVIITGIITAIFEFVAMVSGIIFGFFSTLGGKISTFFTNIKDTLTGWVDTIKNFFNNAKTNATSAVIDFYNKTIGWLFGKLENEPLIENKNAGGTVSRDTMGSVSADVWY